jgi:tRNA dimethylallyltransferase
VAAVPRQQGGTVGSVGLVRPKAVAIVGTNASGKSDIAVRVAEELGAEVLSADSRQVYRGFDLCSGKITPAATRGVPHHLVDLADPRTRLTLHDYLVEARRVLDDLDRRGVLPLLVGGTPLYAEAVVRDYALPALPPDPVERAELESRTSAQLVKELESFFPGEADRIGRENHRRLVRAVERARRGISYAEAHEQEPSRPWRVFGVTWPMPVLEERIRQRLDRRLAAGMVAEVSEALARGLPREVLWDLGLEYRHILRHLDGELGSVEELTDSLARAIRRFAKRQLAWFCRWPDIRWTEGSEDDRVAAIVADVRAWLST